MFIPTESLRILLKYILETNDITIFPILADKLEDCGFRDINLIPEVKESTCLTHLRNYKTKCSDYLDKKVNPNYIVNLQGCIAIKTILHDLNELQNTK